MVTRIKSETRNHVDMFHHRKSCQLSYPQFASLLTQNRANTLECTNDRQNDQHPRNPGRTGLTGFADRSDRCRQGLAGNLEQRAREGPRRSS